MVLFVLSANSVVHEKEVRDLYYTLIFSKDGLHISFMVQGVEIHLDKTMLGKILDVIIQE